MSEAEGERSRDVPSSIPSNWAVPAQDSAAAAGVTTPPRSQAEPEDAGHPFLWLFLLLLTAALAWLVTVGFLAPDAPVDEDVAAVLEALEPPPEEDPAVAAPTDPGATPEPAAGEDPSAVPSSDPSFPQLPPAATDGDAKADDKKADDKKADDKKADDKKADDKKADDKKADEDRATSDEGGGKDVGDQLPVRRRTRRLVRRAERRIELKNYAGASKLIKQALRLDPNFARAHRARAVVCAQRGDGACAREGYETYLKLAPNAPDAPDVRRLLELGK